MDGTARVTPLFIFSLPRSGSTMLQRLLVTHPAISTTTEPWLLLPYVYSLRRRGVKADYGHQWMVVGLQDFVEGLPNGEADYWAEVREMVIRLYDKAATPGARYFLDKTPPYHHIAPETITLFPDGRFVFLWRNPLSVVASVMETWAAGRWNLDIYRPALEAGFATLLRAFEEHRDRVASVRYEDLVREPEKTLRSIFVYLNVAFEDAALERFSEVVLPGHLGDRAGIHRYATVSTESLERWRQTLRNPMRKRWARRYLRWVGGERLAMIGYDLEELVRDLDSVPTSPRLLASDAVRHAYGWPYSAAKARVLGTTIQRWDAEPPRSAKRE